MKKTHKNEREIHIPAGIEGVLSRLEGVKTRGTDQWIARCPAHDDHNPSLSIRTTSEGVLLHCFAGCSIENIVGAMGLELRDLYHEALSPNTKRKLSNVAWRNDAESALNHELHILAMTLGRRVTDRQTDRRGMPPEWRPLHNDIGERERLAAHRVVWVLRKLYGQEIGNG